MKRKKKNSQKTLRDLRPIHNISHLRHFVLYSKDATILETPTIRQSLMNKHLVTVEGKTLLIGRNLQQCQAQGGTAVRLDRLGLKVKSIERER